MNTTTEKFFNKPRRIDILKKIAAFCYKEYNTWSFWDNWLFKYLLWSEWKITSATRIYLMGNAKVLLDSQTIAHIKVMCYYRDFDDLPVVKVRSRKFDLRTGEIKEIYRYIGLSYNEALVWDESEISDKQDEIDFILDKTDEIVKSLSDFIDKQIWNEKDWV
jgi:hypothetical protein